MLINNQISSKLNSMITVLKYIVYLSVGMRARAMAVSGQVCTYRKFVLLILNSIAPNVREYDVRQIDLEVDFYHEFSKKSGIRSERGIASRVLLELDDNLPRNLPELLSVD